MKTNTYRAFEMNVTKEEFKVIEDFCSFLDDMLDYVDDYEDVFGVVKGIAWDRPGFLKANNFKINIEGEE